MGRFYSDDLEKAINILYFRNDESKYTEAVKLIQRACDNQEADAYYIMARCYAWGDGDVECDELKAIEYSKEGVKLGSDLCVLGADRFGEFSEVKPLMIHTLAQAVANVKEMAEAGNAIAQYAVGLFYYWGDALGIQLSESSPDIRTLERINGIESTKWFKMAAEQGHIPAFNNLFISTYEGENGVPRDANQAFLYVESYKDKVQIPHDLCYTIGRDYEEVENYDKMVEWLNIAISKGNIGGINTLGLAYLNGKGMPVDEKKAFELFSRGYEKGHSYSTHNLARCYHFGWGTTVDYTKAFELFEIAASDDVPVAQGFMAQYYDEGLGGAPMDCRKCREWAEKGAENDNSKSKYYLGKCYLYGNGVSVDYAKAFRNLKECVEGMDLGEAYKCLGEMYEKGLGVSVNYNLAVENYQKAVANECSAANEDLARFKRSILGKWKLK